MSGFAPPIKVAHLKDFQKDLKSVDADLAKDLRKGFNEVAELVVSDTRRRVPQGPSGNARASVRVASTQTAAAVRWGGAKAPYYPWLEFGGTVGRARSVKRPWRPGGRYLYPSIVANRDELLEALDEVIVRLFKKAGWDG